MASAIDIANLALGNIGQDANVSSFTEQSAEAEHCARFYPIARDSVLEMAPWTFAAKRAALAPLTNDRTDFAFKYAMPADCLKPRELYAPTYAVGGASEVFEWEGDSLYTDVEDAILVYTFRLTDTTKFSPLFVSAVSWMLSSYLAGPIIKDVGGQAQLRLMNMALSQVARASTSNANADNNQPTYTPASIAARNVLIDGETEDRLG